MAKNKFISTDSDIEEDPFNSEGLDMDNNAFVEEDEDDDDQYVTDSDKEEDDDVDTELPTGARLRTGAGGGVEVSDVHHSNT